jgi:hypothetical protein
MTLSPLNRFFVLPHGIFIGRFDPQKKAGIGGFFMG